MPDYREFAPPERLRGSVECIWVMRSGDEPAAPHRVVPDGCADIIFTGGRGKPQLQFVGAMSRYEDYAVPVGRLMVGMRFHPGMWAGHLGAPGDLITDKQPALEDFWGRRARVLLDQLSDAKSPQACVELLVDSVRNGHSPTTPMQAALAWMRSQRGVVKLDEVANHAGLSARQFRRVCLEQAGLSPKLLARILRFRYALSRLREDAGDHAGLAADSGYFDQSHFIADFQRFSGRTPTAFGR